MKKLILTVTVLALCSFSCAQTPGAARVNTQAEAGALLAQPGAVQGASHSRFSSADCAFTFTSGADNTFLKYCVTANGNITVFESPAGQEHIAIGKDGEGYGLCDNTPEVAYNDYAEFGDSGNWGPATVLNQDAKSVTIARTTSDGFWTLTQTFTQVAGKSPSVKIAMTLKNNTAVKRTAILVRYADVDAAGVAENNLDGTLQSAFGWNSNTDMGSHPFGLVLQNVGTSQSPFFFGFVQDVPDGPPPCNVTVHQVQGPLTATDGSIVMAYAIKVPAGKSKTVTVRYRGF